MFVVRNVFKCKPGKAKVLIEKLKKANQLMRDAGSIVNERVLVDEVAACVTTQERHQPSGLPAPPRRRPHRVEDQGQRIVSQAPGGLHGSLSCLLHGLISSASLR